jgi:hypothetical protein
MDKATKILAGQMLDLTATVKSHARASAILDLTILSFLLERQWPTLEELETRVQQVRRRLPAEWDSDAVTGELNPLLGLLKDVYGPKPRGWTPQVIEGGLRRQDDEPDQP